MAEIENNVTSKSNSHVHEGGEIIRKRVAFVVPRKSQGQGNHRTQEV